MKITKGEADKILETLEAEDFIRIEAPNIDDKPVQLLIADNHIIKSELSMTSHKAGNILINSYLDWKMLAGEIVSLIETITGFSSESPLLIFVGIISGILSASEIMDIFIDENGTAIIMALQNHKKYKIYKIEDHKCKEEANEILNINGYDEMSEKLFQETMAR